MTRGVKAALSILSVYIVVLFLLLIVRFVQSCR
jgi:hypothetical protein